ncbi:MAG TPA: ATP-binding protein [Anaerohalosphaeraceae bacterium]|nr:GHKL domain-containing protein [Phycisphaerae bacterium]HOK94506.1 ATP-binding protein [Anaerohalosphaeraceae bacterium]HOL31449.1 ATP-binding protein [Anaerohalosphaeraceae bacterium]HOM75319.1 ATP-binding protein [Anaerohalosphaeraceae bacterium]HPC63307.1 ATP-binding protein [Anaerohalosphaeraceae bacterium]
MNTKNTQIKMPDTFFAPAGREQPHQVRNLNARIESNPYVKSMLDALPMMVLVLNSHRQIVAFNETVLKITKSSAEAVLGKRPGEVIKCVHAGEGPDGCGTSAACRFCGAVQAVLQTQADSCRHKEECRILMEQGLALDWKVTVCPLMMDGYSLVCVVIEDIGDLKRRQVMERIFLHDMINHLGAIVGFTRLLAEEQGENEELKEVIQLADGLLEEVQAQRDLMLAENCELEAKREPVALKSFLDRLVQLYRSHPVSAGRLIVAENVADISIETDPSLLRRVVGNMIKNALEASEAGQTITVSCRQAEAGAAVSVHNPAVMPPDVQMQIFNRSFSTKTGTGRGIGTYSMKLLGETYLHGQVTFESSPEAGTTFTLTLPLKSV